MSLADKAKLLLIPSGYKASEVYSVFPTNGDGDFTFSRTGEATRINPGGLIETVATQVPRIDHYGGGCPSLLLESSRTNNILNSESLSNASWQKFNGGLASLPTITDNYAISPSGEMNASRLQMSLNGGTTASDRAFVRQAITSQTDYYFSVYLKSTNGSEQKLNWHYGGDDFLITVTNEWQRFELSRSGVTTVYAGLGLRGNLVSSLGIDDSVDILVYGFQAEQGSHATSYIPTNGSIATRNIDICINSGNTSLFNVSELSLFIDVTNFENDTFSYITLTDGQSTPINMIRLEYTEDQIIVRGFDNGTIKLSYTITSLVSNQRKKVLLTVGNGEFKTYFNGVLLNTAASATIPSGLDSLSFSNRTETGGYFQGKAHDVRFYNTVLTESESIELTTL